MPTATVGLSIRIPLDLHEKIIVASKKDGYAVSKWIRLLIEDELEHLNKSQHEKGK